MFANLLELLQFLEVLEVLEVLEKQESEVPTTNNKHKVTILGDSNTKDICKHLNKNENLQLTTIMTYTTEELLSYSTTQTETITKAQHILIHTGTNDLKTGEPAVEVFNRMEQATTNIRERTNAQITIITPPPIGCSTSQEVQRRKLKSIINKESNQSPLTIHEQCGLKKDGIHIDETSARLAADLIAQHINLPTQHIPRKDTQHREYNKEEGSKYKERPQERNQSQTNKYRNDQRAPATKEYDAPVDMMPHIIGREGRNMKRMEEEHKVTIYYKRNGHITIRAEAHTNIDDTINDNESKIETITRETRLYQYNNENDNRRTQEHNDTQKRERQYHQTQPDHRDGTRTRTTSTSPRRDTKSTRWTGSRRNSPDRRERSRSSSHRSHPTWNNPK